MVDPTVSIPNLPNDVITEVLTRLPVKSLLKCRCVCKSWKALISSQEFVRNHLKISKSDPSLCSHKIILNNRGKLKQFSVDSMLRGPISDALELDCPVQLERNSVSMVGSCDGLICLVADRKDLFLWNPCTRLYKKLPDFGLKINVGGFFYYCLGFGKSGGDYKVVAGVFNYKRDFFELKVKVYSLRSDKWKRIKNYTGPMMMDSAKFVNGKLYWFANKDLELESVWDIVSLDLEKEEYGILRMPSYVESGYYWRMAVSEEGSMYLMCCHLESADVWMMDGGSSMGEVNWTKVVTIPYIDDFLKQTFKTLLYVLRNGQVMFLCDSTFVTFNAKDCTFWYPENRKPGKIATVAAYLESLVSPVG